MSQQGRERFMVDSARFAREGGRVEGDVGLDSLPRLADAVEGMAHPVRIEAVGSIENRELFLSLSLSGEVDVRCQRCLGELAIPLRLSSRFLLVEPGQPWPDDELADDRFDAIEADPKLDLLALAEDEILLALPIAPRHEKCEPPVQASAGKPASPFAGLVKLKRH